MSRPNEPRELISFSDLPEMQTLQSISSGNAIQIDSSDVLSLINRLNELQIMVNRTFDLVSRALLSSIPSADILQPRLYEIEYEDDDQESIDSENESTDGIYYPFDYDVDGHSLDDHSLYEHEEDDDYVPQNSDSDSDHYVAEKQ